MLTYLKDKITPFTSSSDMNPVVSFSGAVQHIYLSNPISKKINFSKNSTKPFSNSSEHLNDGEKSPLKSILVNGRNS